MTSLFSLTGGKVLKRELRQLERASFAVSRQNAHVLRMVGVHMGIYTADFQSYALATIGA